MGRTCDIGMNNSRIASLFWAQKRISHTSSSTRISVLGTEAVPQGIIYVDINRTAEDRKVAGAVSNKTNYIDMKRQRVALIHEFNIHGPFVALEPIFITLCSFLSYSCFSLMVTSPSWLNTTKVWSLARSGIHLRPRSPSYPFFCDHDAITGRACKCSPHTGRWRLGCLLVVYATPSTTPPIRP